MRIKGLKVSYGKIQALQGISIEVPDRSVVTIVGSNGAGKSTLLRTVVGLVRQIEGSIEFDGQVIESLPPHRRVKAGIVLTPEGRRVFPRMTVKENIAMGAFTRTKIELEEAEALSFSMFPRLKDRYGQMAGTLSGGEQQMLAIARALLNQPRLMMMDEPSMGLSPLIVEQLARIIQDINAKGISIILVEQNARMALNLAHRAYVLEAGRCILEGRADALINDDRVKNAYLGG